MKIEFLKHVEILRKEWDWKRDINSKLGEKRGILTYTMKVISAVSIMPC